MIEYTTVETLRRRRGRLPAKGTKDITVANSGKGSLRPNRFIYPLLDKELTKWRGDAGGDGLTGLVDCDKRSLGLEQLNLSKVVLANCLHNPDESIPVNVAHERLKTERPFDIRLDIAFALALQSNPELYPDEWKCCDVLWEGLVLRRDRNWELPKDDGWINRVIPYTRWEWDQVEIGFRDSFIHRGWSTFSALLPCKYREPRSPNF